MKQSRLYTFVAVMGILPACNYVDSGKTQKQAADAGLGEIQQPTQTGTDNQTPITVKTSDGKEVVLQIRNGVEDTVNTNVGLLYDFSTNTVCSGTLISNNLVLTAAHCVRNVFLNQGLSTQLKFTNNNYVTQADLNGQFPGKPHAALLRTRHTATNMTDEERSRDVAIIKLSAPVSFYNSGGIRLNDQVGPPAPLRQGDVLQVTGWGADVGAAGENVWLRRRASGLITFQGEFSPSLLTFSAFTPSNQLACQGDSGGPVVRDNFIMGVLSSGSIGTCENAVANHFSHIGNNNAWIYKTKQELNHPCMPLAGDANLDYVVNGSDLMIIQRGFGIKDATWVEGDFTADGVVDSVDVNKWKQYFGQTYTCP